MARYMAPYYAGKAVYGVSGIGIPGATIRAETATGDHGPGFLYDDWDDASDDAALFRLEAVTWPTAGTLKVDENGAFYFADAPDGVYSFVYKGWRNGVDSGNATETLRVGSAPGNASGSFATLTITPATASAKGKGKAQAALTNLAWEAPTASAKGKAKATATLTNLALEASTAGAKGKAKATANLTTLSVDPATVSGSAGATATGDLASFTLECLTAIAKGRGKATASFAALSVDPLTTPSTYPGNATAILAAISVNPATATARGQDFLVPANRMFTVPTDTAPDETSGAYLMQPGAAYEFGVNFKPGNGLDGLAEGEAVTSVTYTGNRYTTITPLLQGQTCKFKVSLSERAPVGVPIPVKIVATTSASPANRLVYTLMILPSLVELVMEA